jgi:hypothetical protein
MDTQIEVAEREDTGPLRNLEEPCPRCNYGELIERGYVWSRGARHLPVTDLRCDNCNWSPYDDEIGEDAHVG